MMTETGLREASGLLVTFNILHQGAGFMSVFILYKFMMLSAYDLCTFVNM